MTIGRRIAVGVVVLAAGAALFLNLRTNVAPKPELEWDWAGLEEDLDMLESLPVDGASAWLERSDDLVEELAAVDALPREELGRHLPSVGRLLAVAGAAAEASASYEWPRFGSIDGHRVNVSWYRAARLVRAHPELQHLTADDTAQAAIDGYVRAMAAGELPATDRIAPP
jgi:hypothetical protein